MIEVRHLTKKYGPNTAVKDISFTVEKGRIYGFLGPNGAGKSTTMNIICGCLAATEGEVIVGGHDIYEEPLEARRLIGYLPEIPPLYTEMTPKEYLGFVARAKKIPAERIGQSVEEVMTKTALHKVSDRLIRNLSKGYRQRVGIAQAILGDPEVIILDEPTVGLDPMQIIEIRDLIRELGKEHTVILSSHVLSEISATCDYVIVIAHGQIVASDTLENLNRTFSGTEIIKIEAKANAAVTRECFGEIGGIDKLTVTPSPVGAVCEVEVSGGKDIREDIFRAFASREIPILSMSSNSQSLEDIFIKLVNEEHVDISGDTDDDSGSTPARRMIAPQSPYYGDEAEDDNTGDTAGGGAENDAEADKAFRSEYSTLFGDGEDDADGADGAENDTAADGEKEDR